MAVAGDLSPCCELALSLPLAVPSLPLLWLLPHPSGQRWNTDGARQLGEQGTVPGGCEPGERCRQQDGAETFWVAGQCASERSLVWWAPGIAALLDARRAMVVAARLSCTAQHKQPSQLLLAAWPWGNTHFGGPFGICCNLQCSKPGNKAGIAKCILACEAEGAERPCSGCVQVAMVAKGHEDTSIPVVPDDCYLAVAGCSSSWVKSAVSGSAAFSGLAI